MSGGWIIRPMSDFQGTFIQHQSSVMSVDSDSHANAEEVKTKVLMKFFCGRLYKEELAEDDKPRNISRRFVTSRIW